MKFLLEQHQKSWNKKQAITGMPACYSYSYVTSAILRPFVQDSPGDLYQKKLSSTHIIIIILM